MNIKFQGGGGVYLWYFEDANIVYSYYADKARGENTLFEIIKQTRIAGALQATHSQLLRLVMSIFEAKKIVEQGPLL
jgi:hypothetical protein